MERSEILVKLQDIIRGVVDNDDIVIEERTVAQDVEGWDSLAQVLIIGEIQNEFSVKLTSTEIHDLANVGALADVIIAKM